MLPAGQTMWASMASKCTRPNHLPNLTGRSSPNPLYLRRSPHLPESEKMRLETTLKAVGPNAMLLFLQRSGHF
jgi:hypothetical protein